MDVGAEVACRGDGVVRRGAVDIGVERGYDFYAVANASVVEGLLDVFHGGEGGF